MGLFAKKRIIEKTEVDFKAPVSLGVIMDGNGRWAKQRNLPRSAGHRAGADNLKELCKNCGNLGVKYLTVYAFSTENWSRPSDEVETLMNLFVEYFGRYDSELEQEGIRVRFSGDIEALPERIREVCKVGEERSKNRQKMQLIVAFNYGGRRELVQACQSIAQDVVSGKITFSQIDEKLISSRMYLPDVPDPDLIIRPSGEKRLSNFLLWESAYSEFVTLDCLWPDFGMEELKQAILEYSGRDRRFGGLSINEKRGE